METLKKKKKRGSLGRYDASLTTLRLTIASGLNLFLLITNREKKKKKGGGRRQLGGIIARIIKYRIMGTQAFVERNKGAFAH